MIFKEKMYLIYIVRYDIMTITQNTKQASKAH